MYTLVEHCWVPLTLYLTNILFFSDSFREYRFKHGRSGSKQGSDSNQGDQQKYFFSVCILGINRQFFKLYIAFRNLNYNLTIFLLCYALEMSKGCV